MSSSVIESIVDAAAANPAAPAFMTAGQIIRYERLPDLIAVAAKALQYAGVKSGDVVGVTMMNTPLHVMMLLGIAATGACSVPLHPQLPPDLRQRLAEKFGLAHLLVDASRNGIEGVNPILVERLPDKRPGSVPLPPVPKLDAILRIQLTSGTSGEPKGVRMSHRAALAAMQAATPDYANEARLLTADLNVAIGFYCMLITLSRGGCLVYPQRYDLASQADAIVLHAVTHLILTPLAARKMLPLLPAKGLAFPSLRQLRLTGGAPSAQLVQELVKRATPHIYSPYTLTELARVTDLTAEDLLADPRTVGMPGPGVDVRIGGPYGSVMPTGMRGEILIRRRGMPAEYVNDPERSAAAFRDGWFHTGDLGYLSEEGKLYVEGRIDDIVTVGDQKIAAALVEDFIMQHPEVQDAAIIPDGATLTAVVVFRDRQAKVDLKAFCQPLGARAPARFIGAAAIPRNSAGKVMRELLQHELALTRA